MLQRSDFCNNRHVFLSLHLDVPPLTADPCFFYVVNLLEMLSLKNAGTRAAWEVLYVLEKQPEVLGCLLEI